MSAYMRRTPRVAAVVVSLVIGGAQLTAAPAWAAPDSPADPQQDQAQVNPQDSHNVTYRARVDGVARGALITYKLNDTQVQSVDPAMLPGRTFEAQTVLNDAQLAGMQVSIQWPYSANLHCEILVDDAIVAQADQFIRPRITPADDDPDYGKLLCGAPLISGISGGGVSVPAVDPAAGAQAQYPVPEPATAD